MNIEGKSLYLSVVSPDNALFEGDVSAVQVPVIDGLIGVLPGHAPLISVLGFGLLTLKINDIEKKFVIDGGFLEVMFDKVTVLANSAVAVEDIDSAEAQSEFDAAMKSQPNGEFEIEQRQEKLAAMRNRIKFAVAAKR